eukprot:m.196146 g.196146  ORF g.196146 m.196146 type:complete len:90 (+) comp15694_c0_seq35:84-353(+)
MLVKCVEGSQKQQWRYDKENKHLVSVSSGLCMDPMRFDGKIHPNAFKKNKWPVSLQPCGKSEHQKVILWEVDVEENAKHADKLRQQGKY